MLLLTKNQKNISRYSIIVCVLIALFSIFNVYNSALFGRYSANRTYVYYIIGAIVATELIYLIFNSFRYLRIDWFTTILSLLLVYILILDYFRGISSWTIIVHCGTLLLWIITYKYIDKTAMKKPETINVFRLLIVALFYLFSLLSVFAQRDIADIRGQSVAVVNLSYYSLACLPLAMLGNSKKMNIVHVIVAVGTSIYSLKRGAIVTIVLMLLFYFYIDGKTNRKTISALTKVIMVGVIIVLAMLVVDYYSGGFLSARFTRTSLLDGSGRARMISSALDHFRNRSFSQKLFGTGSGTSSSTIGITLHNDYLEFMYCFGYLGLLIYVIFVLSIFRKLSHLVIKGKTYASAFAMICSFILGLSLFEGVVLNFAFLYIVIQIAIIEKMLYFDKFDCEGKDVSQNSCFKIS